MRKVLIFALLLVITGTVSFAQDSKGRAEMMKLSKKELKAKSSKAARKEAKRLKKEGWVITPGALPLDKQLDKSYTMQYMYDENMFPMYIMGEAMSIGENYDAAKMQALELCKQNLAGQIQTEITALIKNSVANKQLEADDAASITESVMASQNLISQSIGRVVPVVECYRIKENRNREVNVRIAYNSKMAMENAKRIVREDLQKKSEDLHKKLDKVLGW